MTRPKRLQYKKPDTPIVHDLTHLHGQLAAFIDWLTMHHYAARTITDYAEVLSYFNDWASTRGITRAQEITLPILERYQRYLFHYRKEDGEPLSIKSQLMRLSAIRMWFRWLIQQQQVLYNPAASLILPRKEKRLPRHILTSEEAEHILNQPDITTTLGLRDRAILETLYSTGMRRMEILNLDLYSIDAERGIVTIRQGKGKKDRIIPIGDRAAAWVQKYRHEARPWLMTGRDPGGLFLGHRGDVLGPAHLTLLVRRYIQAAHITKRGSCHLFRHTMATLMLENGADIRYIQAMLGHAELSTTQIYTQVSIKMLKQIHTDTHPAKMARHDKKVEGNAATQENDIEIALFAALDGEHEQDKE